MTFQQRTLLGAECLARPMLPVLGGRDHTVPEFETLVDRQVRWPQVLAARHVNRLTLASADHTFSDSGTMARVAAATVEWLDPLQKGQQ